MSIRNLDQLFDPASVAVFGASQRAASVGATVWTQLRAGAFKGPLYAVNPKYRELGGQPVYARAAEREVASWCKIIPCWRWRSGWGLCKVRLNLRTVRNRSTSCCSPMLHWPTEPKPEAQP